MVTLRCVAVPLAERTPEELIEAYEDPLVMDHVAVTVAVELSLYVAVQV